MIVKTIAAIVLATLMATTASAAEPEDKELLILQLKKANYEFALENMQLQRALLDYRIRDVQTEQKKIGAEIEAKEKGKK